tara:strand:+ start:2078 stop:3052 length:975 start_codon:yes stop_codon:yes gene_type:complete
MLRNTENYKEIKPEWFKLLFDDKVDYLNSDKRTNLFDYKYMIKNDYLKFKKEKQKYESESDYQQIHKSKINIYQNEVEKFIIQLNNNLNNVRKIVKIPFISRLVKSIEIMIEFNLEPDTKYLSHNSIEKLIEIKEKLIEEQFKIRLEQKNITEENETLKEGEIDRIIHFITKNESENIKIKYNDDLIGCESIISKLKTIWENNTIDNELNLNKVIDTMNELINLKSETTSIEYDTIYELFSIVDRVRVDSNCLNQDSEQYDRKIPQRVKDKVWNRDGGKCVECGSNQKLEFDHIIPHSKGGANTYRNLQLLCEPCNRTKSAKIG